jgi:hypothetical protein
MGARPDEKRLMSRVSTSLATLLAIPETEVEVRSKDGSDGIVVVSAAGQTFVVAVVSSASAGLVADRAGRVMKAAQGLRKQVIPLVAVSVMGESGMQACERAGVSWFDFNGNARIIAPGIRVIVEGRPNQFRRRGRPASIFAPKSSRVARWLLMHPADAHTQREIARATGVSEGFVSRIVARLLENRYVVRRDDDALRVKDPRLLLDAWQEQYDFAKHTIIQGHIAARSGDAVARFVSDTLREEALEHAATGLAAAWQLTRFAAFRIATFFIDAEPSDALRDKLGLREEARGANTWLVVPNDAGVFQGANDRDGIMCVHPVQAYLDLKGHPERASEAAARIRSEILGW